MNNFYNFFKKYHLYHFHIGALEKIFKRYVEPILTARSGTKKKKLAIFTICIVFPSISNGQWRLGIFGYQNELSKTILIKW